MKVGKMYSLDKKFKSKSIFLEVREKNLARNFDFISENIHFHGNSAKFSQCGD